AVVVVKDIAPVARDIQIDPPVSVVVSRGRSHTERAAADPGLFRNIAKRTITIVMIACVPERSRRYVEIRGSAVHQIYVHPSIIVVVKESAPGPHRLRQKALR